MLQAELTGKGSSGQVEASVGASTGGDRRTDLQDQAGGDRSADLQDQAGGDRSADLQDQSDIEPIEALSDLPEEQLLSEHTVSIIFSIFNESDIYRLVMYGICYRFTLHVRSPVARQRCQSVLVQVWTGTVIFKILTRIALLI